MQVLTRLSAREAAAGPQAFADVWTFEFYDGVETGVAIDRLGRSYRFRSLGDSRSTSFRAFELVEVPAVLIPRPAEHLSWMDEDQWRMLIALPVLGRFVAIGHPYLERIVAAEVEQPLPADADFKAAHRLLRSKFVGGSIVKDGQGERPVPSAWRPVFTAIVAAFVDGDFALSAPIVGVAPVSTENAAFNADNVADYGEVLKPLPAEAWETSVFIWQEGWWEVLVDLHTLGEGRSDLVLHARVYESQDGYRFEDLRIYVP